MNLSLPEPHPYLLWRLSMSIRWIYILFFLPVIMSSTEKELLEFKNIKELFDVYTVSRKIEWFDHLIY